MFTEYVEHQRASSPGSSVYDSNYSQGFPQRRLSPKARRPGSRGSSPDSVLSFDSLAESMPSAISRPSSRQRPDSRHRIIEESSQSIFIWDRQMQPDRAQPKPVSAPPEASDPFMTKFEEKLKVASSKGKKIRHAQSRPGTSTSLPMQSRNESADYTTVVTQANLP